MKTEIELNIPIFDNFVFLVGELFRSPEVVYKGDLCYCRFFLRIYQRKENKDGNYRRESPMYFPIFATSENAKKMESFSIGDRVRVEGRLEQKTIENRRGEAQKIIQVKAFHISSGFIDWDKAKKEMKEGTVKV
jgi:single-stranded DNA-binding protein